jgi:hypothetical protein
MIGMSMSRQQGDELDAAPMSLKQIVDEIANDQIGFSGSFVHNAARQDLGRGIPLHVNGAAAIFNLALHLGPTRRSAGFALEQDFKMVCA